MSRCVGSNTEVWHGRTAIDGRFRERRRKRTSLVELPSAAAFLASAKARPRPMVVDGLRQSTGGIALKTCRSGEAIEGATSVTEAPLAPKPAQIAEWGEADESTEMLEQRSFGNLAHDDKVSHRILRHVSPHV